MTVAPIDQGLVGMRAVDFVSETQDRCARVRALVRTPSPLGQFVRFVVVGGSTNIVYLLLYVGLVGAGEQTANAVGVIVSTVLANELHRRLTFHAAGRVTWRTAQVEGGGLAVLALLASSAALGISSAVAPGASALTDATVVIVATGVIGVAKFFALRGWVFRAATRA